MATNVMDKMDPDGDVEEWIERFQCWVSIQDAILSAEEDKVDSRKVDFLLSCIGPNGYKILKAYASPANPRTMPFDDLIKLLTDNMAKKQSTISETYKFNCMKQETAESLSLYMSRLKLAASKCEYGETFDRMVKDRFICGLRSEKLRAHLINDATITTAAQAMKKAEARENSEASAHHMASSSVNFAKSRKPVKSPQNQNQQQLKSKKSKGKNSNIVCSKCTLRGHTAEHCQVKCRSCKRIGHIKANCYQQKRRVNNLADAMGTDAITTQQSDIVDGESHLWLVRWGEKSEDQQLEDHSLANSSVKCDSNHHLANMPRYM